MPSLWEEVYGEFRSHCEAHNNGKMRGTLVFSLGNSHAFTVCKDGFPDELAGIYDPTTKGITIAIETRNWSSTEKFVPSAVLEDEGHVILVSRGTGKGTTPKRIAQSALKEFLTH